MSKVHWAPDWKLYDGADPMTGYASSPLRCNRIWWTNDAAENTEGRTADVEQVTCGHCLRSKEYLEALKASGKAHLLLNKLLDNS